MKNLKRKHQLRKTYTLKSPSLLEVWNLRNWIGLLLVAMLTFSCTKDEDPQPAKASSISLISGANQTAITGADLPTPIEIIVKDNSGNGMVGIKVKFAVVEGEISKETVATDSNGKAKVVWKLGATIGLQKLVATAFKEDGTTPLTGSPLTITATAEKEPAVAAKLELISGDSQTGKVNEKLTNPIKIIVKDQFGEAFKGATVKFTVAEGETSKETLVTDLNGKTEVTWQLGSTIGVQKLVVTAFKADGTTPLSGSPLAIAATAEEKIVATKLELISGDSQTGKVNEKLTNPIKIIVKDQFGEPFKGATVKFIVAEGAISDGSVKTTNAKGVAEAVWQLGQSKGLQKLEIAAFKADNTTQITGSPIAIAATAESKNKIGDIYKGGIIFYLDNSGEHGLVCSVKNLGLAPWGCMNVLVEGSDGEVIGKGSSNTIAIVAKCGTNDFAAKLCTDLVSEGFDDWFLPSKNEAVELINSKSKVNTTLNTIGGDQVFGEYWTSTQLDASAANTFKTGRISIGTSFKNINNKVRAVRAF